MRTDHKTTLGLPLYFLAGCDDLPPSHDDVNKPGSASSSDCLCVAPCVLQQERNRQLVAAQEEMERQLENMTNMTSNLRTIMIGKDILPHSWVAS